MAAAEGSNKKMIILKSSDGEFEVEEFVTMVSQTICHMIENGITENCIPLPDINSKILSKVIEYCNKHIQAKPATNATVGYARESVTEDLDIWDGNFIKVNKGTLFDLILAAHYLNIKGLLDLTCQVVADMMTDKTPEEIREMFDIKNDYTPEEEENIRRENQWAFE